MKMEIHYPYTQIKGFLSTYYNQDDLDGLFFDVFGEGTDALGNDLPREKLAQEIVGYCKRRENLPNLLDAMKRTREEQYLKSFPQFQNPLASLGMSLKPAEIEVQQDTVDCINLPRVQKLGGYVIDEPPENWRVDELTLRELLVNRYGKDLAGIVTDNAVDADRLDKREILMVSSRARLTIEYDPGVSTINGRITLQIAPEELPVASLVIMPLERNSTPPTFLRQSFEHVFLANLAQYLQLSNLKSSTASATRNTNRLRLTAELDQRVENVIVHGIPSQSLTTNQTMIGIQGYTRDYVLTLSYISQATTNKAEIDNQVALLQTLVDSFKIIKPADVDAEERQMQALGDARYEKYIHLNVNNLIMAQFGMLISQWRELNWDKAESKKRFIGDVKRMQKAVEVFAIEGEEIKELMEVLGEMTKMGRPKIKAYLNSDDLAFLNPPAVSDDQANVPDVSG